LVLYIDSAGEIATVRLNLVKSEASTPDRPRVGRLTDRVRDVGSPPPEEFPGLSTRATIADFRSFVSPFTPSCFAAFQRTVAIVDGEKSFVSLIEIPTGVRTKAQFHNSEITCVAEHKRWLASADRDAIVNVIDVTNLKRPLFSIPLYRDEITCLTLNADFKVIASGTRDGFLVLSSLNRGSTVHVVDLQSCRPYSVLITNSWGFVVVCSTKLKAGRLEHILMVYNVNGMFLRSKVLPGAMKAWTTWSSTDGFDFLVLATEQGKVFACEVFWLDLKHVKGFHGKSQILELRYSVNDLGFVAVCQSGEVAYVPYVHSSVSV
jgi:WD40 repeat protein